MASYAGIVFVVACTLAAVALCVLLHFAGLLRMGLRYRDSDAPGYRRVLFVIFGVMALHLLEIAVFGGAWWVLNVVPGTGTVAGATALRWHDALFMSVLAFTSLGFDNLTPLGPIRVLAGVEALTGFVLITWSASFAFLQMERHWRL